MPRQQYLIYWNMSTYTNRRRMISSKLWLCVVYCDEGRTTTHLNKNILAHFILERVWSFYEVWETDGDRLLYWPTTILTYYFCWPKQAVLFSRPHLALLLLNRRAVVGHRPKRGTLSNCKLALTQPSLTLTGISTYYFITPTTSDYITW